MALVVDYSNSDENIVESDNSRQISTNSEKLYPLVLETQGLSKVYGYGPGRIVALRNVSFAVRKGEFVSIIGPSGCGKSTLLNLIGALDRPTSGKVFISGVDVFSLPDHDIALLRNKMIGFVFQSYNLINRSTIQENVEIPAIISEMGLAARRRRAAILLQALGIGDKAHFKPSALSGGQLQRVAIARSLMNNPAIILADEPTGNLDSKSGEQVFELLRKLSSKYHRTIVMVTHNQELAALTDRSIYMRDGAVEKEVVHQPRESMA
jgi:putative ABC transport system ATP-binding protein